MFFKSVLNHARDMFQKAPEVGNRLFSKGREITADISRGLNKASGILGTVGDIGQQILNSGTAQKIMGMDDRLRRAGNLAQRGLNGVNVASGLAGQMSDFTNEGTYTSNHDNNLMNAIERARRIKNDANAINYV